MRWHASAFFQFFGACVHVGPSFPVAQPVQLCAGGGRRQSLQAHAGETLFPRSAKELYVPWITRATLGVPALDAAWTGAEEQLEQLCTIPGFGEGVVFKKELQRLWDAVGYDHVARRLPKVSASCGDNKPLHNDANGTCLTAHVVVDDGSTPSKMTLWYGRTKMTMVMSCRTTFFNATLPHQTQRDVGRVGNSTTDKVYLSAYWGAPAERVVIN